MSSGIGETHEGPSSVFKDGTLEMTDPQHGKHSYRLSPDTQVMIDGRQAKPEDLKADMKFKVSTKKVNPQSIAKIEAKSIEAKSKDKDSGDKAFPTRRRLLRPSPSLELDVTPKNRRALEFIPGPVRVLFDCKRDVRKP